MENQQHNTGEVELRQGDYWRALDAIPEQGIKKDMVLLLESIRDVDKQAHTIILRAHPSMYARHFWVTEMHEDGEHRISRRLTEHRFLVEDFLIKFVPELNHEAIRKLEVEAIQKRIGDLQSEIAEAEHNPVLMQLHITEGMETWEKKKGLPAGSSVEIASTQLVPLNTSITPAVVDQMKLAGEQKAEIAKLKADWIKERVESISETVREMTPYFQEKAAAALSRTEDVIRYVNKLQKSIQSLDLYVGTGVEVRELRRGMSASEDLPLTIMQKKLYADEELAVYQDVTEDFDHLGIPRFLEALSKHEDLVNQLFASERCVVAYAATRRIKDYGDIWSNKVRNDLNRHVGLLVRDGQNLYAVQSPIDSHIYAHNLFPGRAELDRIFLKYRGSYSSYKADRNIDFMDVEYTDRLEEHEAFALHYKRFLILLAGLDHRLDLFGKFYEGEKNMDFISPEFQAEHFRFIHDDDGENMLPEPARQPLQQWIDEKNAYLRSGSRVLCMWWDLIDPKTAPGMCKPDNSRNSRRDFNMIADPTEKISLVIARREGEEIVVSCPAKRTGWTGRGQEFDARVSLTNHRGGLAYLVLDAVTADEMEYYIHSRECRRDFLAYMKFFKLAVQHLREVEQYELKPRAMMRAALEEAGLASGTNVDDIIHQTVIAWRAAHRGEPLPNRDLMGEIDQAKWASLLNQMHVQMNASLYKQQAEEFAAKIERVPLRLVVTGKDRMALYVAPTPEERDDRVSPHVWVNRVNLKRTKDGLKEVSRGWVTLPERSAAETTLHEWDAAKGWAGLGSKISFNEKREIFQTVASFKDSFHDFFSLTDLRIAQWNQKTHELSGLYVGTPSIAFPIGVMRHKTDGEWFYIVIAHDAPEALIHKTAATYAQRKAMHDTYIGWYSAKRNAEKTYNESLEKKGWYLTTTKLDTFKKGYLLKSGFSVGGLPVGRPRHTDSLEEYINQILAAWSDDAPRYYGPDKADCYLVNRGEALFDLDDFLGIDKRKRQFTVSWTRSSGNSGDVVPWGECLTILPLDKDGDPVGESEEFHHISKTVGGCSSHNKGKFFTLEEARAYIQEHYDVVQTTKEGALQPITPGAERWWVKTEGSDE